MPIICAENMTKRYGKGLSQTLALDHISLTIEEGGYVALRGPSGSGKSTLLHLLGGVDRVSSGEITVGGKRLDRMKESDLALFRRRVIGIVYQFYNLVPTLNVEENLTLPLLLDGKKPDKQEVQALAERLGITDRMRYLPNQLSGGQQQRVAIGRALIAKPAVLLADEPTGNLDSQNAAEILDLLDSAHKEQGQTILLVTHDPDVAARADYTLYMSDGRFAEKEDGTV